jgi:MoxR-like ATPase
MSTVTITSATPSTATMSTASITPAITSIAARETYDTGGDLPAKGSRVWITGFTREEHDELARLVDSAGFLPTAFATGADAVLVPDRSAPAIVEESERAGRKVLLPGMFREVAQARRRRTALEITDESVRILDVTIARRPAGSAGLLPAERFAHLCLDATFLAAARNVAIAAHSRLPCALEGDTAVAKTTAVLWVAHLCRQEAVRLNLNGQSDTGELVGRFVPAVTQDRAGQAAWRFWEGIVPDAMRHGRWVVLDELNLAEPQVLERLNPVLEQPPSLVLTEHTGERFGLGGDVAIADSFRIFATMNPAEYAGRSVLSPAFRDRWSLWSVLEPPGEPEYRAMLARLVHGVHPEFMLDGIEWRAADGEPIHPQLAVDGRIDGLLDAIASFHGAVAAAAGGDGGVTLGRARRERYVFTRRTMLAAMSLMAGLVDRGIDLEAAACEALELVYLQRVQPGPDRQAVRTALRTAGLSR